MRKILVAVALCFILCLTAVAQQNPADQPATQADVERYLDAIHSHDMLNQMVEAMAKPMHNMVHEQYLKDKDKLPPDFEERMIKTMDDMLKNVPWDDMMKATVPVYQKHLTKGDIDALVTFYSSPTGQKMLHELPALMAESMEAMMPVIQGHIDKVAARIQTEMADATKNPTTPAKKAPSATRTVRN
jgi:uncharacterized protein